MTRWPISASSFAWAFLGLLGVASLRAAPPPPSPAPAPAEAAGDINAEPVEPPPAATDSTAARILQNFLTVEGGVDNLKKIALIQANGTEFPLTKDAVPIHFTYWIAPPGRARLDTVVLQKYGKTQEIHQAISGNTGWTFEPTARHPEVDDIAPAKLPALVSLAAFVYPFINYEARGLRYQYSGQEKFRGLSALVVKAWLAPGPPEYLYFDPQNFLLLRIRRDFRVGDTHTWANTYFTKYEKTGGIWFPTIWEHALSDAVVARTEVQQIQLFPAVDAALFTPPVVKEIVLRQASPAAAPAAH
jgi:hypothetical protein